jgi:DNA-binding NarL/FixJ family response regulator
LVLVLKYYRDTAGQPWARMKILVIDDHALIREASRGVLKQLKGDASVLEASSFYQSMRLIEQHPDLDLILFDLNLPDRDGFSGLAELRDRYPTISVVVLSAFHERDNIVRALNLGAVGFIPKATPREVMLGALQLVFSGGVYIPIEILGRGEPLLGQPAPMHLTSVLGLTERQLDVLVLMTQGRSNKAIARTLNLAEQTVKNHIAVIFKALQVANRTEAVVAIGKLEWKQPSTAKLPSS